MSERRSPPLPIARLVLHTLAFACGSGVLGWLLGRGASPRDESPVASDSARRAPDLAALTLELAEMTVPDPLHAGVAAWAIFESQLDLAFARHGLAVEVGHEERAASVALAFGRPAALAGLFDGWAEACHRADHRAQRDARTKVARLLDPDPTRDAIRAALLANGATEIRMLGADAGPVPESPRTSALLGLAMARVGEPIDALSAWESGAIEWPDDAALHLLLGWWLPALDPPQFAVARRHLEAARALLPQCRRVHERLSQLRD